MLGLEPGGDGAAGRILVRRVRAEAIDGAWRSSHHERLVDHRYADGRVMMTVDSSPERGYRIGAPGHGTFRIAADGSLIECAPAPSWRWHRPFFAQALPIAAGLNRMEVLHASGVVIDGEAIAFVGHSGAGKTSLAVHLVDQGATLLADDVVALSSGSPGVTAHPGVPFANVAAEQIEAIPPPRRSSFGRVVGRSEKLHLLVSSMATAQAPLRRLYFLERHRDVSRLEFEPLDPPDPGLLLGATFMTHIADPARLTTQLDVCSRIATAVPTYRLAIPPGLEPAALAPIVVEHNRATAHRQGATAHERPPEGGRSYS